MQVTTIVIHGIYLDARDLEIDPVLTPQQSTNVQNWCSKWRSVTLGQQEMIITPSTISVFGNIWASLRSDNVFQNINFPNLSVRKYGVKYILCVGRVYDEEDVIWNGPRFDNLKIELLSKTSENDAAMKDFEDFCFDFEVNDTCEIIALDTIKRHVIKRFYW